MEISINEKLQKVLNKIKDFQMLNDISNILIREKMFYQDLQIPEDLACNDLELTFENIKKYFIIQCNNFGKHLNE